MRGSTLDEIDLKLLGLLQEDGRMSQHDLAEAVGLSSPATGERLRKLEERGVIRGFTAVLDPKLLGQDVTAFIAVGIDGSKFYPDFVEKAREHPEIMECHAVTGQGSHLVKIRTRDTSTLERLLAVIQSWPGVHWTTTSIVLSSLKESTRLTVDPEAFGDA
jgi:Lrp/AsnC family transcriptional regulator, leucine-responsive regulatory protein